MSSVRGLAQRDDLILHISSPHVPSLIMLMTALTFQDPLRRSETCAAKEQELSRQTLLCGVSLGPRFPSAPWDVACPSPSHGTNCLQMQRRALSAWAWTVLTCGAAALQGALAQTLLQGYRPSVLPMPRHGAKTICPHLSCDVAAARVHEDHGCVASG